MATAIVGNAAIAIRGKEVHLVLKGVRRQWPAVTEDNRLSGAPILIVNLCSILRCDSAHNTLSFLLCRSRRFKLSEFAAGLTAIAFEKQRLRVAASFPGPDLWTG